jgi:hypothetical protein
MLTVLLFTVAAMILLVVLLLVLVVAGIRQEPADTELASRAQRPTAALVRLLLGVHVRRSSPAEDTAAPRCSCLVGHGSDGEHR